MRPESRLEAQAGQVLGHAIVDLVGDAATFGFDGLRLVATLLESADVFNRDDHMTVICGSRRSNDAYRKERAVSMPNGQLCGHRLASLHLLHDGLDGRAVFFRNKPTDRHAHYCVSRVAIDQYGAMVGLQNDRRTRSQVDEEDADGHVLE